VHGILVLDKSPGMTSATAVEHVRKTLGVARAGHGGTLDPIATGVLPICLGAGTKLARFLLADDKAYVADGVLGIETDTLDRTGRVVTERSAAVSRDALCAALAAHLGEQDQIPPMYSAIQAGRCAALRSRARRRGGRGARRAGSGSIGSSSLRSSPPGSGSRSRAARARTSAAWSPISAVQSRPAPTSPSCAAPAAAGSRSTRR